MDLVRLLRSLEEFLYELVGWLVFYPRTFWRILRHPGAIARYTRMELARDEGGQFQDTISPVLMLILSVGIAHGLELVLQTAVPTLTSPLGQRLLGSEQGLLLTRSVVFCIYALGASLATLRRERKPITRETLREPFSIQTFLVCPFLVLNALGFQLASIKKVSGTISKGGPVPPFPCTSRALPPRRNLARDASPIPPHDLARPPAPVAARRRPRAGGVGGLSRLG